MKNKNIDLLGIINAGLCMIHCLVFPLFTFIPSLLRQYSLIDIGFALVGLWAIIRIIKNANILVIVILLNSITLILLSIFIDLYIDLHTNFIFLGGFGMITGHFLNYKLHTHKNHKKN
jgi:hypothetical protein|nr:MerC domain-containing protein [uncultured Flavobacterium sp.]